MEADAVRDGIKLAADMRLQRVIIETDALELVNLWREPGTGRPIISSVCQVIRELSGFFSSFILAHVNRGANEAAHSCAHIASPVRKQCMWINYTPAFLASILLKDCTAAV
jgi:hypothetical protein